MPPLVARPPVIPLRSSTPVTALRKPPSHAPARHGDGLALFRGTLAHRAIELWFTSGERPPLVELSTTFATDQADREIERVASDVDAMLDLLDASPFAATLRDQGTRAYFELPFSWDWNGAPVHGTIDLAYESGGAWHVVDFKTGRHPQGRLGRSCRTIPPAACPLLSSPGACNRTAPQGEPAVPQDVPAIHPAALRLEQRPPRDTRPHERRPNAGDGALPNRRRPNARCLCLGDAGSSPYNGDKEQLIVLGPCQDLLSPPLRPANAFWPSTSWQPF